MDYRIISYATFETIRAMVAELSPRGMAYLDPGSGSYLLQLDRVLPGVSGIECHRRL